MPVMTARRMEASLHLEQADPQAGCFINRLAVGGNQVHFITASRFALSRDDPGGEFRPREAAVAHVHALDQEDHRLRDVLGVVGDALDALAHRHEVAVLHRAHERSCRDRETVGDGL